MQGSNAMQVAAALGIHHDTLYNRCEQDLGVTFSAFYQEKWQKGNDLLHQSQFKNALKGNATIQIWLGKQRLNQKDNNEQTIDPKSAERLEALLAFLKEAQSTPDSKIADKSNISETKSEYITGENNA
jgi:hypothetical protein